MDYYCLRKNGDETFDEIGVFTLKETPTSLRFEYQLIELDDCHIGTKPLILKKDHHGPNAWKLHGESTYTVYPNRLGAPYIFTPLPCSATSRSAPESSQSASPSTQTSNSCDVPTAPSDATSPAATE